MNVFLFLFLKTICKRGCIDFFGGEGRGGEGRGGAGLGVGLGVVPKREPPDLRSLEAAILERSKFIVFKFMLSFYTIKSIIYH